MPTCIQCRKMQIVKGINHGGRLGVVGGFFPGYKTRILSFDIFVFIFIYISGKLKERSGVCRVVGFRIFKYNKFRQGFDIHGIEPARTNLFHPFSVFSIIHRWWILYSWAQFVWKPCIVCCCRWILSHIFQYHCAININLNTNITDPNNLQMTHIVHLGSAKSLLFCTSWTFIADGFDVHPTMYVFTILMGTSHFK